MYDHENENYLSFFEIITNNSLQLFFVPRVDLVNNWMQLLYGLDDPFDGQDLNNIGLMDFNLDGPVFVNGMHLFLVGHN